MDKEIAPYIQTNTLEYYLAIKNENLPFVTAWMKLEGIMLSERRQRKTNTIWYHIYVEYKNENKTNRLIDTENKPVIARGEGTRGIYGAGKWDWDTNFHP